MTAGNNRHSLNGARDTVNFGLLSATSPLGDI
jgi:hypothetical protein